MSVLAVLLVPAVQAQPKDELPRDAFGGDANYYSNAIADGPVARLQKRIEQGQANLKYDPACGYLLSILDELHVLKSSQLLVFSKTSSQRERISPKTPRAIYFNHEVYLGRIPAFQKIPEQTKRAIRNILIETKPDIPRYWTL